MRTTVVRAEALITRLIFEHSLRMRITPSTVEPSALAEEPVEVASISVTSSAAESTAETADIDNATDATATAADPDPPTHPAKTQNSNAMGKLNNLVSRSLRLLVRLRRLTYLCRSLQMLPQ